MEKHLNGNLRNNIFISGSADIYTIDDAPEIHYIEGSSYKHSSFSSPKNATNFIDELSKALIRHGFNIVSGFGKGVGSYVTSGALEETCMQGGSIKDGRLILEPFPQGKDMERQWQELRESLISQAGVSIFLFGNKLHCGELYSADGVMKEFEIARSKGHILVPIGYTGGAAYDIWDEIFGAFEEYYPNTYEMHESFMKLDYMGNNKENIDAIVKFIKMAIENEDGINKHLKQA